MHITGTELNAASTAVAGLAIIGGYFGIKTSNQNALKLAKEERSEKRKDELEALLRVTYAKTLASLAALATANIERADLMTMSDASADDLIAATRKRAEAFRVAYEYTAELELLASKGSILGSEAFKALTAAANCTSDHKQDYIDATSQLRVSMRVRLNGRIVYDADEYHRIVADAEKAAADSL